MCAERHVNPIIEVDGGISPANAADVGAAGWAPARCWQRRLWQGKPRQRRLPGKITELPARPGSHEESVRSVTARTTVYLDYAASAPERRESLAA